MDVKTFQSLGLDQAWGDLHDMDYQVNGRANIEIRESLATVGDEHYHPCPEAYLEGELQGTLHVFDDWDLSSVYAGTRRRLAIYLPPESAVRGPLNLLICNDGEGYRFNKGAIRAPAVLDNLLAAEELGPTAAVFVMPGIPDGFDATVPGSCQIRWSIVSAVWNTILVPRPMAIFCWRTCCPLLKKNLGSR